MPEPPKTINAMFIFLYLKVKAILKTAIKIVRQSVIESLPMAKQTEIIIATEAMFTASKKAENKTELRIFLTSGFRNATKTKEGRKIAIVEITAPDRPLI